MPMKAPLTKHRGKKAKRKAGSAARIHGRDNMVADIVDQITRKQAREAKRSAKRRAVTGVCSFCLDKSVVASTYRVVLKCDTGDISRTGH